MKHLITSALALTVGTVAGAVISVTGAATAEVAPASPKPYYWHIPAKPCKFEDSRNCYWDAGVRGNGKGRSFWTGRNGKVHYLNPNFRSGR
jgi:hypothetical protein